MSEVRPSPCWKLLTSRFTASAARGKLRVARVRAACPNTPLERLEGFRQSGKLVRPKSNALLAKRPEKSERLMTKNKDVRTAMNVVHVDGEDEEIGVRVVQTNPRETRQGQTAHAVRKSRLRRPLMHRDSCAPMSFPVPRLRHGVF